MLNNRQAILAIRTQLLTVEVTTTGSTTLAATATGFTRATGSFITDDFVVGQEVTPSGFTNNAVAVIKSVTATEIVVDTARPVEVAASGRTIKVGLPELRAWENKELRPNDRRWFIEEEFIPGVNRVVTSGPLAEIDHEPMYVVKVYGLPNRGVGALYNMADGILDTFRPRLALTLVDTTVLRVTSINAPYRGQVMLDADGFALIVVTIPFWARTRNTI